MIKFNSVAFEKSVGFENICGGDEICCEEVRFLVHSPFGASHVYDS